MAVKRTASAGVALPIASVAVSWSLCVCDCLLVYVRSSRNAMQLFTVRVHARMLCANPDGSSADAPARMRLRWRAGSLLLCRAVHKFTVVLA